tara:strand:- start:5255 stop:8659 length:3405 start_codon:yes stop_codon:yes gene_type:complete
MSKLAIYGIVIQLTLYSFVFAIDTKAQKSLSEINTQIGFQDVAVAKALRVIEEETEFQFAFRSKEIPETRISVSKGDKSLNELLQSISQQSGLSFRRIDRIIHVKNDDRVKESVVEIISDQMSISGKVTDENGEALPGATVLEKGTTNGTITDVDGNYKLSVPEDAALLVSFVGYQSMELLVNGQSAIDISMIPDVSSLDEVVVVGYGEIKKSDLTGAVSQFKMDGASEKPFSTFDGALQGKVAGVQIVANTGTPGGEMTFRVRGSTSTSGDNQPLIVLDGFPIETDQSMISDGIDGSISDWRGSSGLAVINPGDISSIEVLKDASATAIYGSRGANGVILITTKRGKDGKDKLEYTNRFDFSAMPKDLGLLSTAEYLDMYNEGVRNSNPSRSTFQFDATDRAGFPDVNWQELILQPSFGQTHSLNFSGGDPKMKYALFTSHSDLDGSIKEASNFKRTTARLNLDRQMTKWFKFATSVSGELITNQAVGQSNANGNINGSIINALLTQPTENPYDEFGELRLLRGANGGGNPVTLIQNVKDDTKTYHINANHNMIVTILEGLTLNARVGMDYKRIQRDMYQPMDTRIGLSRNGYAYSGEGDRRSLLGDFTINLNRSFARHSINAVAGFSHQEWLSRNLAIATWGFASDNLTHYSPQSGNSAGTPQGRYSEWGLNSFLGRVAYSFDSKYLLTLTGRADGSTRLAEGYKWAFFPSIGMGWNLHNESFLSGNSLLSLFKIRGSWGASGNQSVGVGASQSTFAYKRYSFGQDIALGYYLNGLGNPTLGWETTTQINIGFETGFINNRFTFNFDAYRKETSDLLFDRQLPDFTGYSNLTVNGGTIENKGLEFQLGAVVKEGVFKWDVSANLSINRNKVLDLGGLDQLLGPAFNANLGRSKPWTIARVGHPIGSFYGYMIDGLYQTNEELANGPDDPVKYLGGFKWLDISGPEGEIDGRITDDDQTIMGNPYPDFIYGITNDLSYKGISLSIFIMGSQGNDILNLYKGQTDGLAIQRNPKNTTKEAYYGRWTGPGTSNKFPRLIDSNQNFNQRPNNFLVEDGSFIRLKTVTLAYNLPVGKIDLIQSVRIYITGNNLITISKYSGFDPEINSRGFNSMSQGFDLGSLPQVRTYSTGLSIVF